jgi:hypothetical protein
MTAPGHRRRAATAMEYLFVLSLIIVAAIWGISQFGQSSKATMQGDADAVKKALEGQ